MKKISIVTLQEIINESKNDLTVDELLARANIEEDDIDWEDYEVLREWTSVLVNEALDAILMRSAFCAEEDSE
ncbi:TPA: hypothetical protein ACSPFS_001593 [Enterococcus faecium]|uniref:hypothetical protein n=1 Tax=Enterococcus TaxID=1350 RepID=UPI0002A364EA|nr:MULTISPECIES: hypothetical protein [Enterococcus]ELA88785.1 hypothetical protein OI5_04923 [Enterococcus faecium EnGen0009]MCD5061935.1 hypothetical protein [Enterococcus faecium]MCD5105834.1 hypothetical protein [Enterococcus faecium]MDB7502370.1 hypothetical protein [Enterococcus faecium]MDB7507439.1 hypothetical protein [Enterococcus faecium]